VARVDDSDKYVLEQAKIEVDHTRSWPTKILAFYVAINFGLVASLAGFASRTTSPAAVSVCAKVLITIALAGMFLWSLALLVKNHLNYLRHRNVQVRFQQEHLQKDRDRLGLPTDWFRVNEVSVGTRALGWCFYLYVMILVTALALAGLWLGV
jgi:hypothetical protein